MANQIRRAANSAVDGDTTLIEIRKENWLSAYATGDPLTNAREQLAMRRDRDNVFGGDLFGEPAWDMLLDLFIHQSQGKPVSVSSLCMGSAGPATTALRHIKILTDRGHLQRHPDPTDARRIWVSLSPAAFESMATLMTY